MGVRSSSDSPRPHRLYKVAPPRRNWRFEPSRFWRSEDWQSSTTRPRSGYFEEQLLYAGDFDEVTIHLFPRVHTVRLRRMDASAECLGALGINTPGSPRAYVFFDGRFADEIGCFRPTIWHFDPEGFECVRRGEYVAREARQALAAETISMAAARYRWDIDVCPVPDLPELTDKLRAAGVYFDEQT